MEEYKQGETYQEEDSSTDKEEVSPSALNSNKIKLLAALGVVGMIIAVFVFTAIKKNDTPPPDIDTETSTDAEEEWGEFVAEQEGAVEADVTNDTSSSTDADAVFTDEVKISLRKWGYTGDEITYAMNNGISSSVMIEQAKALQKEANATVMEELSDTASKAYKKLLKMTWLGGKPLYIKDLSSNADAVYSLDSYTLNADYVKCDPKGNQLFLRLTLEDGSYAFMTVEPTRWVELKSKGNIVVQYDLYTYGNAKVIINITEVMQGETDAAN